jgi:hypothetical protein
MKPLRNFYWTVAAVCVFYLPFAADAQLKTREVVQTQIGVWGNKERVYRTVYQAPPRAKVPTLDETFDQIGKRLTQGSASSGRGFNSSVKPQPQQSQPDTTTSAQAAPAPLAPVAPPVVNVQVPRADPPVVNVPAPVVNVAPPQVIVSPTLSTAPATWWEEFKTSATPVLLSLITMILAWRGYTKTPVVSGMTPSVVGSIVDSLPAETHLLLKLRDKVTDPSLLAKVDEALLAGIGTGIPGRVAQTAFSAIPIPGAGVAGGFAQPLLEKAFVKFLESRLEVNSKG